uniref:Dual specificity protein phosphatase 18 n=2 Tax=Toxocara canis TaxID=6265 RepID=A0A183V876_TOXCA
LQIQAILASGGRILIHSVHGVSRCAAICLAYLTKFRCKSLKDAYEKLAAIRVVVAPNVGFWRQLIAFEQEVKQTHGSVHIVRDQNDPSKLVPDVYATINKSSIKSIRQSETDLVSNETKSNVSDSTLVSTIENTSKKCANDIRRSLNRSEETEKRNRRRINYARRNSTRSAKFEPILETLHERLDVAA